MNTRYYFLIVLWAMSLFAPLHAQTYDKMWKEVEQLQKKDLPQSVVSASMKIYDKAKAERDVPQMMKAYLTAMQYRTLVTPDSLETDMKGLENWAKQTEKAEDRAVLYSILGELTISKDVKQGFNFLQSSLKDKDLLASCPVEKLKPMVKVGEMSKRYFHDNLYDLLARRALLLMKQNRWKAASVGNQTNSLPAQVKDIKSFMAYTAVPVSECDFVAAILQNYRSLLTLYDTPAYRSAWMVTGIGALDYLFNTFNQNFSNEDCQKELRSWIAGYPDEEAGAEVYLALSDYLQKQNNQVERLKVVREGISKYPRCVGINRLRNIEKEILNPSLSLKVSAAYPGKMQEVRVNYKNLNGFTLQLYKINLPVTSVMWASKMKNFVAKYGKLQKEENFSLKGTADYLPVDTTLQIQAPQPGIYYLKAVPEGKVGEPGGTLMYVTALRVIYRPLPDDDLELVVVDAESGHPVPDAEVVIYTGTDGRFMPSQTYTADKEGTLKLGFSDKKRTIMYNACTMSDTAMPIADLWKQIYYAPSENREQEVLSLFTDRSIYRPGQTVYVSGIAYRQQQDDTQVLADKEYTVTLYDVNNNKVGEVKVTTNSFGSFSGQFTLPSPCLTGYFRLQAGSASGGFRVEEYKRPTFDVAFEPVKTEYQIGDSVLLTGVARTFAGAPVQNAKVNYHITRSFSWFWRFRGGRSAAWDGETMTDAEGKFTVTVRLEADSDVKDLPTWYYTYRVQADVTDGAGETQQANLSLPLGKTSVVLAIEGLSAQTVKEKARELTFSVTNLSGEPVDTEVIYQVFKPNKSNHEPGEKVLQATVASNNKFVPEALYRLPSGSYILKISAKDAQGRECTESQGFLLFSLGDKRPPIATTDWFYQDGEKFEGDSPATIYVGSSEKNIYLLYDVFSGNKRVESRRVQFSDSIVSFPLTYKQEYGNGVMVSVAFVKDGQLYGHYAQITKPEPDKELQLKWTTFRDKLRPGQQEEWKLSVLYPDGRPADAELLAMMYDASWDRFYTHDLFFRVNFTRNIPHSLWNKWYTRTEYIYLNFPFKSLNTSSYSYSELLVPSVGVRHCVLESLPAGWGMNSRAARPKMADDVQNVAITDVVFEEEIIPVLRAEAMDAGALEETGNVQVRQNFAETAFFYPQLRTNGQGEVSISFILPESLTKWKFMGLAHTKEVDYGRIEATATASKEFMLQPNMPRFVRVGDKANIAASLINLSDKAVAGTVRMELFNPETEKVFYTQKQKFGVKAGETGNVSFTFDVTDKYTVLACRMVAEGDTFSDGEQRYIPVLTDKQWVTESVPLDVNGKGSYTFSLEHLFNNHSRTASGRKMTVEFTSNPVWYAVMALPVVAVPQGEDALSWASAYYANALAEFIVSSNPRIKQIFDSWLAQGGTKETFMSRLQKNEELKNILLAETPWLTEAVNEEEQRQRIATLFDLNTMSNKLSVCVAHLNELQNGDGAWSWYKGMPGNRYMTTQITEMLTRLQVMTGGKLNQALSAMYQKALNYLTVQAGKEYKAMKEAEKKGVTKVSPSEQTLQYLYICALNGKAGANADMNRYFISKLSAQATDLTVYGKALSAIVLQQAGETVKAKEFVQSVMEYSVVTDKMGRYFDTPKAHYSWFGYKIPTEVAAMEAVQYVTKDEQALSQMKRWLLKEKQTQVWDTPVATVNAVYALLNSGTDLLANSDAVKITLGKEVIQTSAEEPVGYLKKVVEGNVLNLKKVTVDCEGSGMGWGAVYAQYLENMDKMGEQSSGLSVSRSLYKGETLIEEGTVLNIGDKITVRLTVKADRDMDFVQIKDERAACMEPLAALSGYRLSTNLGYYQATKDASTSFFVNQMRKGMYVIEYQVYVTRSGEYRSGIATIQSAYAPEFGGHTGGYKVVVK